METNLNGRRHAEIAPEPLAPRPVSVMILGASYQTGNMGVDALLSGTVMAALHASRAAQITLLDYGYTPSVVEAPSPFGAVPIRLENIRFSKNVLLRNNIARILLLALAIRLIPSRRFQDKIIESSSCLRAISRADVVASIAGGDSFSDIYGLVRLLYVSLPQIVVLLLGKQLILLPQTIGPFESLVAKVIARYILHRARTVYARDRETLRVAKQAGLSDLPVFKFSHDMAFALEAVSPSGERLAALQRLRDVPLLVGFNVSGLLYMGGYNRRNMFRLKSDYRALVRGIIRYFIQNRTHVLLIPHVSGRKAGSECDCVAAQDLYQEMAAECEGRLHFLRDEYDHREIKYVIGRCDFFLGSRMHACIGALSQCVPAMGLAYSRKFAGVFNSVGAGDLVIDLCAQTLDDTLVCVEDAFRRRREIRERLQTTMPAIKASVLNLLTEVMADMTADCRDPGPYAAVDLDACKPSC